MNTNVKTLRLDSFQFFLPLCALDESSLSSGRVNQFMLAAGAKPTEYLRGEILKYSSLRKY